MPMKMNEVKSAILGALYDVYQREGLDGVSDQAELETAIPAARGAVEAALKSFESSGLISYVAVLEGLLDIRLTSEGVEAYEDEGSAIAEYVQNVHVHGGHVQVGHGNTQNVTYQTVLTDLANAIDNSPDLTAAQKRDWSTKLREIAQHPLMQTVLGAAAGFAAGGR